MTLHLTKREIKNNDQKIHLIWATKSLCHALNAYILQLCRWRCTCIVFDILQMYLFTTLHIPLQRVLKLFFFFLHRVTNFISLHQDTTTTLFKIKKISYLVFAMYKWSQTSKKKTNQICTVESLYIVGKQTSIFTSIYATFNTKSIT